MKKFNVLVLSICCVLALAACGGNTAKPVTWKLGHIYAEDNIFHRVALKFSEEVSNRTQGALTIKVLPNSLEGNEVDNINGIRGGTSQMTISGESMQTWAPKAAFIAMPYTFQSAKHVQTAVEGEVGSEISANIEEKMGIMPLFYVLRLPRNLTSNRPITKPADLNKMIVRVPTVPAFVKAWEALGAKPTPMALNEVFTALQQNTIEGQENPIDLIYTQGFYEVQKYVNLTEHVYGWLYYVVGKKQWDAISPDTQKAVREAALAAQAYGYEEFVKLGEDNRKKLEEKGMTFVQVDKKPFQDAVKPAISAFLSDEQRPLYEKILAMPSQ